MGDLILPDRPGIGAYFEDEREFREAVWAVAPGDVVIDVGCAEGSYTLPALLTGAWVYAVDPSPERLATLSDCARLSDVAPDLLTTVNEALFDGGRFPRGLLRDLRATADRMSDMAPPPRSKFSTLDDLAQRYGLDRLDWVKIDVEGAEAGVLAGGLETLRAFHPRLIIEDHTGIYPWVARHRSADRIRALLDELGYDWKVIPYVGPGSARNYFVCSWVT